MLSTIFMSRLAGELDSTLSGGFFDKAQQVGKQAFKLSFRTKHGRKDLLVRLPGIVNLTDYKIPAPKKPSNFAMTLRKQLSGKKVERVKQHDFDRVLVIEFSTGQKIVLELFSHGNIILLEGNRIKALFRSEEWKDRKLKPGQDYVFPKKEADPRSPEFEQYLEEHGEKGLARAIGRENARLLLGSLHVPPGLQKYSEGQAKRIRSLLQGLLEAKAKPVKQEGMLLPAPVPGESVQKEYDTASQAVDEEFPPTELVRVKQDNKLERILEKQEQTLKAYEQEALQEKLAADKILEKQHIVSKAINLFRQKKYSELEALGARKTKQGKIELEL